MRKKVLKPKGVMNPQGVKIRDSTGYPWSQAIWAKGEMLFIAGQSSVGKDGLALWKGDMAKQTRQCLLNLRTILRSAGGDLNNVVSTIWFVTDIDRFYDSGASTVRREFFKKDFPTSTLVEIRRLADPAYLVEVQAFAVL